MTNLLYATDSMVNCIAIIPVLDAQLVLSILLGFSNPDGILSKPQVNLRSQHIPTVSVGKTQPPTIYSPATCTRENIRRHEEYHFAAV